MAKAYVQWLVEDCGYRHVRILPDGRRWAAVCRFMFTTAVIVGRIGEILSYDDRWCYHDEQSAIEALEAWDGTNEPTGWHRHPATGRRFDKDGVLAVYA
jgi:hypothetical protein